MFRIYGNNINQIYYHIFNFIFKIYTKFGKIEVKYKLKL